MSDMRTAAIEALAKVLASLYELGECVAQGDAEVIVDAMLPLIVAATVTRCAEAIDKLLDEETRFGVDEDYKLGVADALDRVRQVGPTMTDEGVK